MRRSVALVLLIAYFVLAGIALADNATRAPNDPAGDGETYFSFGETASPAPRAEASATPSAEPPARTELIVTAAGDVTIGGNMRKNPKSNWYTKLIDGRQGDLRFFFANVRDIFENDDLTIVNFEGTLTDATKHKDNEFVFKAPRDQVAMLTLGSVEAVSFENNHVMDFYEKGRDDTIEAFRQHGVVYARDGEIGEYAVKGVSVGMLAYQTFDRYDDLFARVPGEIAAAKAKYDLVIVSFHWGFEKDYAPRENQIKLGRMAVDAGADLVLGHHSHRINPIELYNGRYIVYSLSNCSFSGNTQPSDMDTFLFQQKFFVEDGAVTGGPFRIIPCSISSATGQSGEMSGKNDLMITPFAPDGDGARRVTGTMLENGQGLAYAVPSYPTEWP